MKIEWDMPEHWEAATVSNSCETQYGYAFDSEQFTEDKNKGTPVIRIGDLGTGETELNFTGEFDEQYIVEPGDLLISMDRHFHIYEWAGDKALLNQRVCRIESNTRDLRNDIIKYYLEIPLQRIKANVERTTVPHLSKRDLENIQIPIPPHSEQKDIIKRLDEVFNRIDDAKEAQKKSSEIVTELTRSTISSLIERASEEHPEVKVKDVCSEIKNGGTPKRSNEEYWGGDIPWLKSGELNDSEVSDSEEYMTQKGLSESSAKIFDSDTVLVAMYGATRGETAYLKNEMSANQAVCGLTVDENQCEPKYLWYCMRSLKNKLASQGRGGGQDNINQTTIRETTIPLPPISVQSNIIEKIESVEKRMTAIRTASARMEKVINKLPKSVLRKAFSGEMSGIENKREQTVPAPQTEKGERVTLDDF